MNAEQLAQRILECRLLESRQTNEVFSTLGSRGVNIDEFKTFLLSHEYLTNWQLQRVESGHKTGFFYGKWKVLYIVGTGTFARVYRSTHVDTGDVRAVKVLRNRYTDDPITRERFLREAQTVMRLRHPNIVPIYEVEHQRGRIYMVMDFIEGQNLREFVKAHGKIGYMSALKITRDVLNGLDYATRHGVTHRDVKMSNVLLSSSGKASLVDFGLAAADDHDDRRSGFYNPRSVDYAGLEKTTGAPRNDKRSDLFFAGCNLYHMIAGVPPLFETRERMKRMSSDRYRNIPPLSGLVPTLPHRVVSLVNRMMALNPEDRHQTAREALDDIHSLIGAVISGDVDRYDPALAEKEAAEYAQRKARVHEGRNKIVMIIESSIVVQDTLRTKLKKIGYRPLIFGDPARALERFQDMDVIEELPADIMVFSCAGLGMAAIDAFNKFQSMSCSESIPSILLIREEQLKAFLSRVKLDPARHKLLGLPVKFPLIRTAIRQLLKLETDAAVVAANDIEDEARSQE